MTQPPNPQPADTIPGPQPVPSLLSYQTSPTFAISRTRQAACITLLANGILTLLCGGGTGLSLLTGLLVSNWLAAHGVGIAPAGGPAWPFLIMLAIALIPTLIGIASIICSRKIRRGSQKALITALTLAGMQFALLGTITLLGLLTLIASRAENLTPQLIAMATYTLATTLQAATLYLLLRLFRQNRGS